MPTVPSQVQVRTAPLPGPALNVQSTPETFGAGVARGVGDVGEVAHRIQMDEIRKANEIADNDSMNQLYAWDNTKLSASLQKRGKDAITGMPEDTLADYDKTASEIEMSLGNNRQKEVFRLRSARHRLEVNGRIQSHVAGEIKTYDHAQMSANVLNLRTDSVNNPMKSSFNTAEQKRLIEEYGVRNGIPADSEYTKLQVDQAVSGTHLDVLHEISSTGNYDQTKKYYDAFKSEFKGNDLTSANKLVQETTTRGEAQSIGDSVMLKIHSGEIQTEEDAVAEAIKQSGNDPAVRDRATDEASKNWHLHERSLVDINKKYMGMADEMFTERNLVSDIDPGTFSKLNKDQQEGFRLRERQFVNGENVADGSDAYYKMSIALKNPQLREKAVQVDLMTLRPYVSKSNFNSLIAEQASAIKDISGDRKTEQETRQASRATMRERVVSDTLKSIGFDPEEGRVSDGEWIMNKPAIEFRKQLDVAIDAEESDPAREGKPLGFDEVQKISRRLAADIQHDIPGFWGISTIATPAFQLPNSGKQVYRIQEVPQDYINKANEAAGINNGTYSRYMARKLADADLIDGYNRWLNLPEKTQDFGWGE